MMLCVCEGESNAAVEVWSGYRVRASVLPAVCRRCSLADCLSRCYADGSCYGVDYDAAAAAGANSTCYALNSTLTCASLTPAGSQFIHVSTAHCGQPLTHSLTQQTWNWVIGSPGQWVIWVIFHVRVTGSSF